MDDGDRQVRIVAGRIAKPGAPQSIVVNLPLGSTAEDLWDEVTNVYGDKVRLRSRVTKIDIPKYHFSVWRILQDVSPKRPWDGENDYLEVDDEDTITRVIAGGANFNADAFIPDDLVVRALNGALFYVNHLVNWRQSSQRCPTYGNCPSCFSSGPLGTICTNCSDRGIIGDDSRVRSHRYSTFYAQSGMMIDAEQLRSGCPTALHTPMRANARQSWMRTPPCEVRGFNPDPTRFTVAFRKRWDEERGE